MRTHVRSGSVRSRDIPYEHMFPSSHEHQRLRSARSVRWALARSFLLLEDDYDVDWEVDQDEHRPVAHPHRAPLRRRSVNRRAGAGAGTASACVSPIGAPLARGGHEARLSGPRSQPRQRCCGGSSAHAGELTVSSGTRAARARPDAVGSERALSTDRARLVHSTRSQTPMSSSTSRLHASSRLSRLRQLA